MEPKPYILITGASSGIGRHLAVVLSHDHNLIIQGTDISRLKETQRMCEEHSSVIEWLCDFTTDGSIADNLTELISSLKISVEGFIHCAGIVGMKPARLINPVDIRISFAINTFSAIEISSVLIRKKINGPSLKNILFMSSIRTHQGESGYALYASSKGALEALGRSLAVELAPQIKVNTLVMGAVNTPMAKDYFSNPELMNKAINEYPLGLGSVEDIAGIVSFLLSSNSRWITGQSFFVDGGKAIKY